MGSIVEPHKFAHQFQSPPGVFPGLREHQNIDLKQTTSYFSREKWVCSGSAENCNLGSATMKSHVHVPTWQGKNTFTEEKEDLEGYS